MGKGSLAMAVNTDQPRPDNATTRGLLADAETRVASVDSNVGVVPNLNAPGADIIDPGAET